MDLQILSMEKLNTYTYNELKISKEFGKIMKPDLSNKQKLKIYYSILMLFSNSVHNCIGIKMHEIDRIISFALEGDYSDVFFELPDYLKIPKGNAFSGNYKIEDVFNHAITKRGKYFLLRFFDCLKWRDAISKGRARETLNTSNFIDLCSLLSQVSNFIEVDNFIRFIRQEYILDKLNTIESKPESDINLGNFPSDYNILKWLTSEKGIMIPGLHAHVPNGETPERILELMQLGQKFKHTVLGDCQSAISLIEEEIVKSIDCYENNLLALTSEEQSLINSVFSLTYHHFLYENFYLKKKRGLDLFSCNQSTIIQSPEPVVPSDIQKINYGKSHFFVHSNLEDDDFDIESTYCYDESNELSITEEEWEKFETEPWGTLIQFEKSNESTWFGSYKDIKAEAVCQIFAFLTKKGWLYNNREQLNLFACLFAGRKTKPKSWKLIWRGTNTDITRFMATLVESREKFKWAQQYFIIKGEKSYLRYDSKNSSNDGRSVIDEIYIILSKFRTIKRQNPANGEQWFIYKDGIKTTSSLR